MKNSAISKLKNCTQLIICNFLTKRCFRIKRISSTYDAWRQNKAKCTQESRLLILYSYANSWTVCDKLSMLQICWEDQSHMQIRIKNVWHWHQIVTPVPEAATMMMTFLLWKWLLCNYSRQMRLISEDKHRSLKSQI